MAYSAHVAQANRGNNAVRGRAKYTLKQLRGFRHLKFMYFMQDLLSIISELSLNLQKSTLTCVDFVDYLEATNLQLTQLRFQQGEHYTSFIAEVVREGPTAVIKGLTLTFYSENAKYDYGQVCDLVVERSGNRLEDPNNKQCH